MAVIDYRELALAIILQAHSLVDAESSTSREPRESCQLLHQSDLVVAALGKISGSRDEVAREWLVTKLAIHLARHSLPIWMEHFPEKYGPRIAIEAAEAWASCPCAEHAERAAAAQPRVVKETLEEWNSSRDTVRRRGAWAGRTAGWVADAPKNSWQAAPAIVGAVRASSLMEIVEETEAFLGKEMRR